MAWQGAAPPWRARRASCRCAGWRAPPTRRASPCARAAIVFTGHSSSQADTALARLDSISERAAAWRSPAGTRAGMRAEAPARQRRGAALAAAPLETQRPDERRCAHNSGDVQGLGRVSGARPRAPVVRAWPAGRV